jgi:periplasmic protein TonB
VIDGNAVHDSPLMHMSLAASLVLHVMLLLALQPTSQPSDRRFAEQAIEVTLDTPTALSAAPAASAAIESGGPRPQGAMDLVHTAPASGAPDAAHSLHPAPPAPATSPPAPPPKLEDAVVLAQAPPVVTARELATEAPSVAARSRDLLDVVQAPPRRQPERQAATQQQPHPKTTTPAADRAPGEPGRKNGGASYASRQQAQQDYVLQVVHKLSQLRFLVRSASSPGARGVLVAHLTVRRDGALVELSLAKDSGSAEVDGVVLETIRTAAPFAPLPRDVADARFSFIVPITYASER